MRCTSTSLKRRLERAEERPLQRRVHHLPLPALALQLFLAGVRQLVVLALPPGVRLLPDGLHVAVAFEAVEHRVQHAVRPLQLAARELGHALDDGVAIALAFAEDREDQWSGRGGDEVLADVHGLAGPGQQYIEALYIVLLCIASHGHPAARYDPKVEKRPPSMAARDAGTSSRQGEWPRLAGLFAIVAVAYFISGKLGLALASVHPSATLVWAPTGIALAACLIVGMWVWPAIFVAAFAVNVTTEGSIWTSLAIGIGNTLEPLAATHLVNRFADGSKSFETVRGVASYTLCAGILSPMVAATIGVTALALGGYAAWTSYGTVWLTWWAGDVGGALVVAPFILLWVYPPPMQWTRAKVLEAGVVSLATALVSLGVFGGVVPVSVRH